MEIIFSTELRMAEKYAVLAGSKVLQLYHGKAVSQQLKKDSSIVTEADISSNTRICSGLARFGYDIISEEGKHIPLTNAPTWVVDPLDGTSAFVEHGTDFCIMIGLLKNKEPYLGVVYLPISKKMYLAEKNKGAYLKHHGKLTPIQTTAVSDIAVARAVLSRHHVDEKDLRFVSFIDHNNILRIGSIGVKLGLIAEGGAEYYCNFDGLWIWDICAPQIILEEAGGSVSDITGKKINYTQKRITTGIFAYNGNKNLKKGIESLF